MTMIKKQGIDPQTDAHKKSKLFQQLNVADQRQRSADALAAVDDAHNHKYQSSDAQDTDDANKTTENVDDHVDDKQKQTLIDVITAESRILTDQQGDQNKNTEIAQDSDILILLYILGRRCNVNGLITHNNNLLSGELNGIYIILPLSGKVYWVFPEQEKFTNKGQIYVFAIMWYNNRKAIIIDLDVRAKVRMGGYTITQAPDKQINA